MSNASKAITAYFESINAQLREAYSIATKARQKGYDPEIKVDIPLAKNMQERVEGLISIVAPQLVGTKLIERIHELEEKYGLLDWRVALEIAAEVAQEKFCGFESKIEAIEVGIRTGFAYHTLGIVAAPLEGFIGLKIKKRRDGREYLAPMYAGPVRGAGGTAAAVSLIISDFVRSKLGYSKYDPSDIEVERFVTEVRDYHERVTNLQYFPSEEEIRFLVKNLPVEIEGDPTEEIEVSQQKDLQRVATNRVRGGMCLVLCEGLAQKAPKLWKRLSKWGAETGIDWSFLEEFLELQKRIKAKEDTKDEKMEKVVPNYTYIKDLVAGRPVLTLPLRVGGFRLRYGRSRVSGLSAACVHPVTQFVLNKFIAIGTQLKVERPGKATAVTSCDSIEGPIVLLKEGRVLRLNTLKDFRQVEDQIEKIVYLGDILFNYGDFSENNHVLVPAGYCEEWWIKEIEKAMVEMFGTIDIEKLAEFTDTNAASISELFAWPGGKGDAELCVAIARKTKTPLHPYYTYFWNSITPAELGSLVDWFEQLKIHRDGDTITKFVLPMDDEKKRILERLAIPHEVSANEFVVIGRHHALILINNLNLGKLNLENIREIITKGDNKDSLSIINQISTVKLRDKGGTFIGARMGRPEKSKMRKLTGSPHVLFPVGQEGGRLRSLLAANELGSITADFPLYKCQKCGLETVFSVCDGCHIAAERQFFCDECGAISKRECEDHGLARGYKNRTIDINYHFTKALKKLGFSTYPDLIKGVRGTSNKDHIPEHLIKGVLRAKHDVYVNKDGTTRYDMSELPITHFKPAEISTTVEKLRQLGYKKDVEGNPLESEEQLLELKPQDIILPGNKNTPDESADAVLFRVCNFIDELLELLYGQKSFYNFKDSSDLVGHLVIGLAPHISAGMIGRIIGFSQAQGCYAHPLWHAALRRDCDGDECCVIMLMDALLNFSRQFLPDKRGGRTMDAPLVLTSILLPSEVDDMVHGMDTVWNYPLGFYEAALEYKYPRDVKIEQLSARLNTEAQYEGLGFTHPISNINQGVRCSAYKILPTMEEKLRGQMELAEKIMAVDEAVVAELVINKHFLRDIKGNLRKFSQQQFRCVKCNQKYRRPPLAGKCSECGGKIIFTIAEGSVIKYLKPSISLAEHYNVPPYMKQTLELTKRRIEAVFGKEKEIQEGLGKWFG
ncbi:DNA polymerase II large subunit [Candidatus Woesearchaeota archaeon]|nr:DNA polymerase II large subunit [Candidatus Woesearchaeota archaeon]